MFHDTDIDALISLDAFATQVAALDLVISVDNTTVYMAGALGKPVWTLLNRVPDWRWLMQGDRTAWYPSMRLFRQQQEGEWGDVFEQVAQALVKFPATCRNPTALALARMLSGDSHQCRAARCSSTKTRIALDKLPLRFRSISVIN